MRCQCPARPQCSQQQQSTPHYSTSNTRYDTGHSLMHKCVEHTITLNINSYYFYNFRCNLILDPQNLLKLIPHMRTACRSN